jgi:diguanylate cyclase (GGDEF)-like protein
VIARLGGDEFVVFVPNCTKSDDVLERLQNNVSSWNQAQGGSYQLAMSVGVAMCHGDGEMLLEQMLTEADALMYAHKQSKRTAK